jgi:hypothetical protein
MWILVSGWLVMIFELCDEDCKREKKDSEPEMVGGYEAQRGIGESTTSS